MNDKIILKSINELLGGQFYIPHYQRGYRWTIQQVEDLMNDIDSFIPINIPGTDDKTFYCLQPIAVKECNAEIIVKNGLNGKWYEVIDGQQRLTTIYLLIHYANEMWVGKQKRQEFEIKYETRDKSSEFLKQLRYNEILNEIAIDKSNIDFYHISMAYNTINNWVNNYKQKKGESFDENEFQSKLKSYTKIIWYEVDANANGVELFTRLNMGKIPLTNAELIKALFLSNSSFEKELSEDVIRRKMEISQIWDEIEQRLNEEDAHFWSFITNHNRDNYSTKIEILFDLISKKEKVQSDPLHTFLYFMTQTKIKKNKLWDLWLSVEKYYLTLCEWFRDKNLYHKVGYLITIGNDLSDLIDLSMDIKKDLFKLKLDEMIQNSIDFEIDIEELSYERSADKYKIEKILLLFNTESIRSNDNVTEFYPFKFHKGTNWSLEHIHAQNSEDLDKTKKEQWIAWLNAHKSLIEELLDEERENQSDLEEFLKEMNNLDVAKLTWEEFNFLSSKIIEWFTEKTEDSYRGLHSISNLALLSRENNSALNNAVFEVKRREIIKMDKLGNYIPLCTRRAFLKYYNDKPSTQQYYFWGKEDQKNYLKEIKKVLKIDSVKMELN
jgi:uncharacterized protein with ParB-like and HNH nuclease domain